MSQHRNDSVRDKVIGQKQIYLDRNTPTGRVWAISEGKRELRNMEQLVFTAWEDYSYYFGEVVGISGNWATTHFLAFYGQTEDCHGTGGCIIQHDEAQALLEADIPPSWTQLVLWLLLNVVPCPLLSCLTFKPSQCSFASGLLCSRAKLSSWPVPVGRRIMQSFTQRLGKELVIGSRVCTVFQVLEKYN